MSRCILFGETNLGRLIWGNSRADAFDNLLGEANLGEVNTGRSMWVDYWVDTFGEANLGRLIWGD